AWRQMFHESLRLTRDFFYDPGLHGMDLKAVGARYRPYGEGLVTRADLNVLILQMLSELSVSHVKVNGGYLSVPPQQPRDGLLGADYANCLMKRLSRLISHANRVQAATQDSIPRSCSSAYWRPILERYSSDLLRSVMPAPYVSATWFRHQPGTPPSPQ